jgi:hypothetical protein
MESTEKATEEMKTGLAVRMVPAHRTFIRSLAKRARAREGADEARIPFSFARTSLLALLCVLSFPLCASALAVRLKFCWNEHR